MVCPYRGGRHTILRFLLCIHQITVLTVVFVFAYYGYSTDATFHLLSVFNFLLLLLLLQWRNQWVKRQRYQYKLRDDGKHSNLTDERKESLDQIGFVWSSQDEILWEDRIQDLRAFVKRFGHARVPTDDSKVEERFKALCKWANHQREQYKLFMGEKRMLSTLTERRVERLNKFDFVWWDPTDAGIASVPGAQQENHEEEEDSKLAAASKPVGANISNNKSQERQGGDIQDAD